MTNWKEVHPDFTPELQKEWEDRGFSKEECKDWINTGIEIKDHDFCAWLRDYENSNTEWMSNYRDKEKLREKYVNHATNYRNILLIGRTGNGKSTLANILINKDSKFEEIFKESAKGVSETREINDKAFEINEIKYRIIDTPGLGDTSLSRVKTLQEIAKVYDKIKSGLSQVLFVNRGKFTPEEVETYSLLKEILFDEDITKYTTIIRTHFVDFEDEEECENDIQSLLKENNKMITEMIESCDRRVVHIDNPPINIKGKRGERENSTNKEIRKISKSRIIKCLIGCSELYIPENTDLLTKIELKEKYKVFGICQECDRNNTWYRWCQTCNAQHFNDLENWTSGNSAIDNFIKEYQLGAINKWGVLEWIPYDKLSGSKFLAQGGFGNVYKAEWTTRQISHWNMAENNWERDRHYPHGVVLKCLNNPQNVTTEFLQEVAYYKLFKDDYDGVVKCFGISQNPEIESYVMVMDYIKNGNLRQYLVNYYKRLNFYNKLRQLRNIAKGLNSIHRQELIHQDFHAGNVLISNNDICLITDFGLSRSINSFMKKEGQIFGVLPYLAPEVLRGQPYTQSSDVYSFGIIAYELFANTYPYPETDDTYLALKVCQGYRPNIDKVPMPQPLKDLIKRCWDANPEERPRISEIYKILGEWQNEIKNKKNTPFYQQYQEIVEEYNFWSQNTSYQIHSVATVTSKMIDTNGITKRLNSLDLLGIGVENFNIIQKSKEVFWKESEEIAPIEISTGLTKEVEKLAVRIKRQLSFSSKNQDNSKSIKLDGLVVEEPMEIDNYNWQNIHPSFTKELTQFWQNLNLTYQQTQDWINAGFQPTDYNFCTWLRETKKLTPEQVLNHGNLEQLNQEFFNWWQEQQQSHQQIPPKGDL